MPQRGDNPNEVLFDTGSIWAYRNVDNYYDADSVIHRPVDEMLSALEEEFECPLVYLEFRRKKEAQIHQCNVTPTKQPATMLTYDARVALNTEHDRLVEYFIHERLST